MEAPEEWLEAVEGWLADREFTELAPRTEALADLAR